jgi:predicted metalloprotease with PDZ domain
MPVGRPAAAAVALVVLATADPSIHADPRETSAPITYTFSLPDPRQHWMHVDVQFPAADEPLELRMSRASPGRYSLHDFASHVGDLAAYGEDGRKLRITPQAPNAWSVAAAEGAVRLRYRVSGNRLDGTYLGIDSTHAHINMPPAVVWAAGRELEPVIVRIRPPVNRSWRVATQLFATDDPFTFTAPNLHYLIDSPIEVSDHVHRSFVADLPAAAGDRRPPTIELALHHTGSDADADRHTEALRLIVREQASVFGEYPDFEAKRYIFLADYLPWALLDGMEHRDSSVLTSGRSIASGHDSLLALAAHEFFHVWNVERVRPRSLEPFNLLDVNPSGELWLAEGFTHYYESLTMARTGLWTLDAALSSMSRAVSQVLTLPAAARRSAIDTSLLASIYDGAVPGDPLDPDAWRLSHYMHGAALALGFDLALRERTGSARSLDDFMRAMWQRHGREPGPHPGLVGHPYTIDDVRECLVAVSGDADFSDDLLQRYVRGHEVMDYDRLLALAGLRLRSVTPSFARANPRAARGTFDVAASANWRAEKGERAATQDAVEIVRVESAGGDLTDTERAFRAAWLRPRYAAK